MNANSLIDVCRICPRDEQLLSVFDAGLSVKYNMKEVVLLTTGVEIQESDLVSKKICQKCCNITLKMFQFRQDALKQDRELKEMLSRFVENQGILIGCRTDRSISIIIEGEDDESCTPCKVSNIEQGRPSTSNEDLKRNLHPTVAAIYNSYPDLKLPKKCFDRHVAPVVSLTTGDVESYLKRQTLDMKAFIYKPDSKNERFNKVAKKKTSLPTNKKTVTPLKISKNAIASTEQAGTSNNNSYVCSVLFNKGERKRKISLADTDKGNNNNGSAIIKKKRGRPFKIRKTNANNGETLKLANKNIELAPPPTLKAVTEPLEPEIMKADRIPELELKKRGAVNHSLPTKDSVSVSAPTFPSIPSQCDTTFLSRESSSNIVNPISTSSISKPEAMELLGLAPRTFTTKSETLLTCNVCGSVHKNAIELKWHTRNHMVCQFCKRRFKSIEKKANHIDNFCKIKRVMNCPAPIVALETIHLNLEIRKKYVDAFSSFDPIPGLVEPAPLEHVTIEATSIAVNGVIVLSDTEDNGTDPSDPLSDIPTPSANMPSPAVEKGFYKYVGEIRPDLKIKNNRVLNRLAADDISDKELIKSLMALVRPEQDTCERKLQTDLPNSKDIKINNSEGTCQFKYLSEKLLAYKIPIKVSYGTFNASYQLIDNPKPNQSMALWDDLPIIDQYKKSFPKPTIASGGSTSVAHRNGSKTVSRQHLSPNTLSAPPMAVLNLKMKSAPFTSSSPPVPVTTRAFPASPPQYFTPPLFSPRSTIDSVAKQNMSPINLVVNNKVPWSSNSNALNEISALTSTGPLVNNNLVSLPKSHFSKDPSILSRPSNISYSDPRSSVSVTVDNSFNTVGSYPASVAGNIVTGHLPRADVPNVRGTIFAKNPQSVSTNLPAANSPSTIPPSNFAKFRIKDVSELQ